MPQTVVELADGPDPTVAGRTAEQALHDAARRLELEVAADGARLPLLDDVAEGVGPLHAQRDRVVTRAWVEQRAGDLVRVARVRRRGVGLEVRELVGRARERHLAADLPVDPMTAAVDQHGRAGLLVHVPEGERFGRGGGGRTLQAQGDERRAGDDDSKTQGLHQMLPGMLCGAVGSQCGQRLRSTYTRDALCNSPFSPRFRVVAKRIAMWSPSATAH